MKKTCSHTVNLAFEQEILQRVSRSFALTIPQLPQELCTTATTAYLMCRIVDTIEDEENLSISQKRHFFQLFIDVVKDKVPADKFADNLYPLLGRTTLPAEKELIQNTPIVIQTYLSFNEAYRSVLKCCVEIMAAGMLKFQELKSPHGLKNLSQMNNYCYHVAGIVGEMLTELFCLYSEDIAKHREELFRLAAPFGQGLQMTNILKDLWEDKDRGACWLPQEVFNAVDFDLKHLSNRVYSPAFGEGLAELIAIAHHHLKNALAYTLIIPRRETGMRKFCTWAIGMAILTLRNLNKKRNYKNSRDIKISRKTLRAIILVCNVALYSNFLSKVFFKIAARGLPVTNPKKCELPLASSRRMGDLSTDYLKIFE